MDRIATLSVEKQLLLQRRLKGAVAKSAVCILVPRRSEATPALLSFSQHQMWLIDQMAPGCSAYNLPVSFRLKGPLNRGALTAGLDEVIRRHEILRTSFALNDGEPVQLVHPPWQLELSAIDLNHLSGSEREAALQKLLSAESFKPFDLAKLPLLRVSLFKLSDLEHALFINLHHIIADGLSVALLLKELETCYRALCTSGTPSLPELPIQYSDFAIWERNREPRNNHAAEVAFWQTQLSGNLPPLELPWDKPRPAVQSFKGSNVFLDLPAALCSQLQALAGAEGGTFFIGILAAFYTLLHRYSGASDIIIGTPIANRALPEVQPLIGNFLNMLALRCNVSGDPAFSQLLRMAKEVALNAFSNQEVPFQEVVGHLHFQRDPSRNPVFQTMLQVLPRSDSNLSGLEMTDLHFDLGFAQFDLSLHLYETPDGYKARFEYCSDLLDHDTVERMAGHFLQLLRQVVTQPGMPLSKIPILSNVERQQLVVEWNGTASEYPRKLCLHQLFEAQVERTPEAVAVVLGNRQLTYCELNERSNQLASHLRKLGVGPDTLVGVCLERSLEMVVALMAVLKAGGAYVPLDPNFPQERLHFMIQDSRMPVLLTEARLLERVPQHPTQIVCLDQEGSRIKKEACANLTALCVPENLAYVLYTSGSTGQPKGVQIEHRALVNFLTSMRREPGLGASDILLAVTTLSFDIAGLEIWLPLITGARLVIASTEVAMDGERLAELLAQSRATVMQATPATWRMLLEQGWQGSPGLKILCGGEAWPEDLARQLLPRSGSLWNMYGPTETTIWSAVSKVEVPQRPLIGPPIANTRFYVLDPHLQPVPIGVPGQLHIGGEGLARGYLGRAELTAEKFIPDPFASEPGARLYKTGDLVRYRPVGNIEFLGRMDNQVKVRGYRIELGEVESVLRQCPGVSECVAMVRGDQPGDKRLVAYVVVEGETTPAIEGFRDFLKQKLPEYMVPSAFVFLKALPLTANGKIARQALPAPDAGQSGPGATYVAPRTPTEEVLAGIWCEVLGLKRVGIHDKFFELGGHSLLAIRVQVRVENKFGRRLPLAAFFQAPTIAELARLLADPGALAGVSNIVAPSAPGHKPPVLCLYSLFLSQRLARHLGPARAVYGIDSPIEDELRHWDKTRRLSISMQEVAARYVAAIKRVQPRGPYYLLGVCFGGVLAFEAASQLTRAGETVAAVILLDAFYYPGRKLPLQRWMKRWGYHIHQLSAQGVGYLPMKLRQKLERRNRRRTQRRAMLARAGADAENLDLPRDAFVTELVKRYKGQPYSGRVVLFRALTEIHPFRFDFSEQNGWEKVLSRELHLEQIRSHHMSIGLEPHVAEVAKKLEAYLSSIEVEAGHKNQEPELAFA